MKRRSFLKFAAGWGAIMASRFARPGTFQASDKAVSFYVAGARFYKVSAELSTSTPIVLRSDTFKGKRCYSVHTTDGVQLGYVPRKLIPLISGMRPHLSYLSLVDPYAVPWKRYRVTVWPSEV